MFQESQQIGVYTLIKKLGEGGFGEVWLAENRNHSPVEKVAVKLPRNDQIDLQAVKEEVFNWTGAGKHKNILPFIEWHAFDNQIALVSEYAPDGSLQDLINKKGALPISEAVEITIGILDGLAHLHNRKIIHRDLKPDNVLFQANVPRLTDFGISRALPENSQSQTISGTLSYMAPEAFDGKRNAQTDIWAVGVILYQLLTGQLPFPQKERVELIGALVMKEPAPLSDTIPLDLKNIVKKSLAKEVSKRYQTAKTMGEELKNFRTKNLNLFPPLPTEPSIPIDKDQTIPFDDPSLTQEDEKPFEVPPSPPTPNPKWRYFAIPAGLLIICAVIGSSFWFGSAVNYNKQIANTSTNNIPFSSPSATPTKNTMTEVTLIPFRKGDKWGFSDKNKNLIIPPKYDSAYPFSEGLALVELKSKYGFIDDSGNEVISIKYDSAEGFSEGLAAVKLNSLYGFINKTGVVIVPFKYNFVHNFSEGLCAVAIDSTPTKKKYGFIDKTGNEVIPLKYDYADDFSEERAKVSLNSKYGFIDKSGNEIIPLKFEDSLPPYSFSEGLASEKLNGKYGFIDKSGNEVIPFKYDYAGSFFEGLSVVEQNGKYYAIDKTGKEVTFLKYNKISWLYEGLAAVVLNGRYGFIDQKGKVVISGKYETLFGFDNGLCKVMYKNKWFYIDKNGTEYYEP